MKLSLISSLLVILANSITAAQCSSKCSFTQSVSSFGSNGNLLKNPFGFDCGDGGSMSRYTRTLDGGAAEMISKQGSYWYSSLRDQDLQCMDPTRYNTVQLVVREMTLDSLKIFVKNGIGSDCTNSGSEGYAQVTKSDFNRDSSGNWVAHIPLSSFTNNVKGNGMFAVGLVEMMPLGKSFRVVSIDLATCTQDSSSDPVIVPVNSTSKERPMFDGFVKRTGSVIQVNGKPLRFISYNAPDLLEVGDVVEQEDLLKTIADFANGGSAVTRPYIIGTIGQGRLIQGPYSYNEARFKRVDKMLQLANQYKVKVVMPFIDRWHWIGGIQDFNKLHGIDDFDSFYTNRKLIDAFKDFIRVVVNRVNTYTGVQYKNDQAILAWETGNELMTFGSNLPPVSWTQEIADYIKSLDSNHLVMDGGYSTKGRLWNDQNLRLTNVDIYTQHYYSSEGESDYADRCLQGKQRTQDYGKVFFIGEYGLANTDHMKNMIDRCFGDILDGSGGYSKSSLSGALIWSLRGRKKSGGFFSHGEGYGYYAYHYPGFPGNQNLGIGNDEMAIVDFLSRRANALRLVTLGNGAIPFDFKSVGPFVISPLDAPKLVSVTINENRKVVINWRGSIGATYYKLYGSMDKNNWSQLLSGRNLNEFTDSWIIDNSVNLDCGCAATIYYRLVGTNEYTGANSLSLVFQVNPRVTAGARNCVWQLGSTNIDLCNYRTQPPTQTIGNGASTAIVTRTSTVFVTKTSC